MLHLLSTMHGLLHLQYCGHGSAHGVCGRVCDVIWLLPNNQSLSWAGLATSSVK